MMYDQIAAVAKKMIDEFGRSMVMVKDEAGTFDPATYTFSGASDAQANITGVVTNYRLNEIDGEIILRTDKKILLASDVVPKKDYKIVDGTDSYTIIDFDIIQPGDLTIIYKVQARK